MTIFMAKQPQTPAAAPSPAGGAATPEAAVGAGSDSGQVKHMDCVGPVTVLSKTQTATGDNAVYDKPQNKVWLIGHVTLSDGGNVTKGDKLTYDLTTGQATVENGATTGKKRVQSQFIPSSPISGAGAPRPPNRRRATEWRPLPDGFPRGGARDARRDPRPARRRGNAERGARGGPRFRPGVGRLHLGKRYGQRSVVQDVNLHVHRGEAVGLLGPNGAGKTTVFYMITGLIQPDKGAIALDGQEVTSLPMYQRARLGIGYLPQEASIFRGLNVEDNVRAVLEVNEPNRKAREERLDALLKEFNIARLRKSPSIALSGGERRRCEIARALAGNPSFMLLDEPFAGIDPIAVGDIQDLVRHLKGRGIGVLITDHNVRETLGLIDRAYIIHSGQVLTEGPPDAIIAHPGVRRFYLGEDFRM